MSTRSWVALALGGLGAITSTSCAVSAAAAPGASAASAVVPASGGPPSAKGPSGTAPANGYTLGVSPSSLDFTGAMRGADYGSSVTLINGSAVEERFKVVTKGPLASWARLTRPGAGKEVSTVLVPRGAEGLPLQLELHVPATAANGTYKGRLEVTLVGTGRQPGKVSAGVGAVVPVAVQVSATQVIKGAVVDVSGYPRIEVGSPLPVLVRVKNNSNVTVQPVFTMTVSKATGAAAAVGGGAQVYRWQGRTGQGMLPSQVRTYEVDWPARSTRDQALGDYVATMVVAFPDKVRFGPYRVPVQLFPFGSLHRGGRLLGLALVNHPGAGGTALVDARVVSTGEVQQETTFAGRIYRDGTLIGPAQTTAPVLLAPGGQTGSANTLTIAVPVADNGLYRITGSANFAGAQTAPVSVSFRVGPAPVPLFDILGGLLAAIAVAALAVVTWLLRRGSRQAGPRGSGRPRPGRAVREPALGAGQRLRVPVRVPGGPGLRGDTGADGRRRPNGATGRNSPETGNPGAAADRAPGAALPGNGTGHSAPAGNGAARP